MRSSNCSSDVCSSDLGAGIQRLAGRVAVEVDHIARMAGPHQAGPALGGEGIQLFDMPVGIGDRQSVVKRRSVSVRVDPGGRRKITKKHTQPRIHTVLILYLLIDQHSYFTTTYS